MPSIDVAMARSLRPSMWVSVRDALARHVANDLARRNIVDDTRGKVTDIQTALSSWDNCMAASFCKWPVIAIIVVGSLIILSIVVCIVRCCCCGMSCCCSCFSCLKCCGNCCGCCDAPGQKKHKYLDDPYSGPSNHGYQSHGPMQAPFQSGPPPRSVAAAPAPPQYAEFDVSKKGGEDALPQMPSWEGASSKKVMEEDALEMEPLKKSPAPNPQSNPPLASVPGNGNGSTSPMPQAPRSPYGPPQGGPMGGPMGGPAGYMPAPNQARDPYAHDPYAPHSPSFANAPSSQADDGYGLDQPYDAVDGATMAAAAVPNRHSPPHDRNGYGQQQPTNQSFADMPEMPADQVGLHGYGQQMNGSAQGSSPGPQGYGMRRQGTGESYRGPEGYGMRRQGTGDSRAGPDGYGMRRQGTGEGRPGPDGYGMRRQGTGEGRSGPEGYGMRRQDTGEGRMGGQVPYGMDPRARQSPGPRQSPNPRRTPGPQDNPYNQSPRSSPGPQRSPAYGGQPAFSPPQDHYAQNYQQHPPPQEPQELPASSQPQAPIAHSRPFGESPPQSPIVNNAGFDFNSGYSRPVGQSSPTSDGYPGYKPYQRA